MRLAATQERVVETRTLAEIERAGALDEGRAGIVTLRGDLVLLRLEEPLERVRERIAGEQVEVDPLDIRQDREDPAFAAGLAVAAADAADDAGAVARAGLRNQLPRRR